MRNIGMIKEIKKFITKKLIQCCDYLIEKFNIDEEDILTRLKNIKEQNNDR